jgi:hypothetical protein
MNRFTLWDSTEGEFYLAFFCMYDWMRVVANHYLLRNEPRELKRRRRRSGLAAIDSLLEHPTRFSRPDSPRNSFQVLGLRTQLESQIDHFCV